MKVGRAERSARGPFNRANQARSLRGNARGEAEPEPSAKTRGFVVRINASNLDRIGTTLGVFAIAESGDDSLSPKGGHTLVLGVVVDPGPAWPFGGARFANPREGASRIVRVKLAERVPGELMGSIEGSSPTPIVSSGKNR